MSLLSLGISEKINNFSSNKLVKKTWYATNIGIFLLFIIIPTLFVLFYFFDDLHLINSFVLTNSSRLSIIFHAVFLSFAVSFTVTAVDLIFGLVVAWVIAKKNFKGKELVNTLIESPLAIPTAGLGFSVALFWGKTPGGPLLRFGSLQLVNNVFLLIVLFHFTTTFPYVVRSLSELLEEIDNSYEIAALTCGASRFTAARTITLPMFRSGIATAAILSMVKSLSDTGGVVALLTTLKGSPLTENDTIQGTALIDVWKHAQGNADQYQAALTFVALLMISSSLIILFLMKWSIKSFKSPSKKVYPNFEHKISTKMYVNFRNAISFSFLLLFIFVPSFFILAFLVETPISNNNWDPFLNSIALSFLIATIATLLSALLGLTIGIIITRKKSRFSLILDSLIDIPYLVPSAALGISVGLFWNSPIAPISYFGIRMPSVILVIFVHTAMVFPFITRNIVGGLEEFDVSIEETARTLGARPFSVFKDLTLPAIKGSILAGAVMAFTRSVGETGATSAVSSLQTAPVYIVNQIKVVNYGLAALATLLLTVIGYLFIITSKLLINSSSVKQSFMKFKQHFLNQNKVTS